MLPGFRPNIWTGRIVGLLCKSDERHDDGNEDPLEGPQQDDASEGGHGPNEFRSSNFKNATKVLGLDQPDGVDDDHRRQGGLRHLPNDRSEQKHHHQGGRRCDQLRHLGSRTRKTVHRGLTGAAARWHRS